jgi:predicted ArsR family transcriptional regulator
MPPLEIARGPVGVPDASLITVTETTRVHPQRIGKGGSQGGELGAKASRALRYGDTFGTDPTSSAALRSALLGMVNAGWPYQRIAAAVLDRTNAGGRKVQNIADQHGIARAVKVLRREYDQAVAYVRKNALLLDRNGALLRVTEWLEAVDRAVWRGAGGLTDRNTLHAMAERSRQRGSATRVPMSVRTLAETIGCSQSTASESLRRVRAAGWLALKAKTTGLHPALYALTVPSEATRTSPHTDLARELFDLVHPDSSHDVWRWRGLGKGPARIYDAICQKIAGAAEIASHFGITRRAVYKHLGTLRQAGLAESAHGLWYPTGKELDVVAFELGTAGMGVAQRERHAQQRDGYHRIEAVRREA